MALCTSCSKENKDESLKAARDEAKIMAIGNGYPVAIVEEGGAYHLYNAFFAYENNFRVIQVISC